MRNEPRFKANEGRPNPGPSRFLTLAEYAYHVRRSRAWAYAEAKAGRLRVVSVHGAMRVPREELERLARGAA